MSSQLHRVIRYLMPSRSHASPETGNLVRTQTSRNVFTSKTSPKISAVITWGLGKASTKDRGHLSRTLRLSQRRLL